MMPAAMLTTVLAYRATVEGRDLGHFIPFPLSEEPGRFMLVGEDDLRLDVQLVISDVAQAHKALAHDRSAFTARLNAVIPPPDRAGTVPSARGVGGDQEGLRKAFIGMYTAAIEAHAELQTLLSLMDRMEPDVPHADRGTDEEWIERKADAQGVLASGLTAMSRALKASGLTAEDIEGGLTAAAREG